jgi:hypothetical protein
MLEKASNRELDNNTVKEKFLIGKLGKQKYIDKANFTPKKNVEGKAKPEFNFEGASPAHYSNVNESAFSARAFDVSQAANMEDSRFHLNAEISDPTKRQDEESNDIEEEYLNNL